MHLGSALPGVAPASVSPFGGSWVVECYQCAILCPMTATKRAAVYVRLSDYRDDTDPTLSPASQEEACRAYAAAHGWEVVAVEADLDETGTDKGRRLDRPGLARLLRRLDEFEVIIARDLSRFSRSVVDFLTLADRCTKRGVALVALREQIDLTTSAGRMTATILSAVAEAEAAQVGERVRAHRAAAAEAGRYSGGQIAYGMRRIDNPKGPGSILVPDPDEADVIRRAIDLLLEDRVTLYRAAQTLTEEGMLPRSGKPWTTSSLGRTLRNPTLRGYAVYRGALVTDPDGVPVRYWEPIITPEDWARLEPLLASRGASGQRRERSSILSGLAVCGRCGGALHRGVQTFPKRKGHAYDVMRCGGRSVGRECSGVTVKREHVEGYVLDEYLKRFGWMPEERAIERPGNSEALDAVREAITRTTEAMREPGADIPALASRLQSLAARRDALAEEAAEPVIERVATGRTLAEAVTDEETPLAVRQALLADVIDRIEVGPGQRGRRALDTTRFRLVWRADIPEFAYADALRDAALQAE